jgi:hypothetical protein
MEGNHYLREIECYICGSRFKTTASRAMCDECLEERRKEINRQKRANYTMKPDYYIVEHDPIPYEEGGFRCGASLSVEDVCCMLRETVEALKEGTILRNPKGERFKVVRNKRYVLKLILF